jgi:hypothetical protein
VVKEGSQIVGRANPHSSQLLFRLPVVMRPEYVLRRLKLAVSPALSRVLVPR